MKCLGRFRSLWGLGSLREPLEMVTALRMQNMVQIREENTYFVTQQLFRFVCFCLLVGLSVSRAPAEGPLSGVQIRHFSVCLFVCLFVCLSVCLSGCSPVGRQRPALGDTPWATPGDPPMATHLRRPTRDDPPGATRPPCSYSPLVGVRHIITAPSPEFHFWTYYQTKPLHSVQASGERREFDHPPRSLTTMKAG